MTVSDNTTHAKGLGDFFKNLVKKGLYVSKKMAKNALRKPSGFPELTADVAAAAASRNPKSVLSTSPEVIKFYQTGSGLYLGKLF